jgi:hypothetical protein
MTGVRTASTSTSRDPRRLDCDSSVSKDACKRAPAIRTVK